MGVGVPLLAAVLLLSTSTSGRPSVQVHDCRDLKAAIEGDASASAAAAAAAAAATATGGGGRGGGADADLVLHLQGGLPYLCEESVFIAEAQSVLLIGSRREGSSYLHLAPNQDSDGAVARSLFVNKGTLRLENIGFRLDSRGDVGAESRGTGGAAAMAKKSAGGSREKDETAGACAGGVRLVRNFGHVAMREISVFEASFDSGWLRERRCEGRAPGRVVFSDEGEPREDGGGGSGRSVVVSHSKFDLADDGHGTAAFDVNGGKLAVHSSRFDTRPSPLERKGTWETSAGLDASAVAPALAVFDGDAVVANTEFVGFGVGAGRGSGAIAFKESGGFEGQQRLTVSNCSFLGTSGNLPDSHDTTSAAAHLRTHLGKQDVEFAAARFRRLESCSGLPCLDQGLLLVIISAGLLAVLTGMCCLESWLRMHPDGLDRCLPRRFRSTRVRRVQHDHNADKSPASRNSGVDLGGLEAAGIGAAITKPLAMTSVGTGSTSRGAGSTRASSTQLHADQYSVYDGTCDEEVSFVVPQTFKHILAKPQANVRPCFTREPGSMAEVSLDDDTATNTTTESRSSSNESSVLDAKRPACLGIGALMNDGPSFPAAVYSAATGAAAAHDSRQKRLGRGRPACQELGGYVEGAWPTSSTASAAAAADEHASDDDPVQRDRGIREDSLSPDSLQGVETDAMPCDSVSTSTDMYDSGSLVLVRSPRQEETVQAFASVNSLSAAALESSPETQHSGRRLEVAMGNHWQETKADSDGEDSTVAAEETEGRAMSGVQRSWSSPSVGGGCGSPGGYPVSSRDFLWSEKSGRAPSAIGDDRDRRSSASSSGEAATSVDGGNDPVPGILLKAAPFSPLQSPAESSLSALSIGALSRMLHKTHGRDVIPAVERTQQQAEVPDVAARLPLPSQNDSDMCYSPDSDADHEEIGAGFHSNNPMLMGQWPCGEEKVDSSAAPAAAVANRPSEIAAAPATRLPSLQGRQDEEDGSGESSSPAMSRASDGGFLSTRPSSLSCSSEASPPPARKAAEAPASASVSSSQSSGGSSENSAMFIAAPRSMDRDDDDGMCYSSPSTDGSGERREDDDRRMFAVSPAFSTPGRCLMGVSPDDNAGDLLSRLRADGRLQADGARDTSTPQLRDDFVQASTAVKEGNAPSSTDAGLDVQVSGPENGVPDISPPEIPARDLGGAGVSEVVPAACAGLSPVTSSYSLYCSPPSTVGGPSPDGTPDRSLKHRKGGGPLFAPTDRPHITTVEASDDLSSA
ncbi:unnamed protein product [Scytosiphon promiscuus]